MAKPSQARRAQPRRRVPWTPQDEAFLSDFLVLIGELSQFTSRPKGLPVPCPKQPKEARAKPQLALPKQKLVKKPQRKVPLRKTEQPEVDRQKVRRAEVLPQKTEQVQKPVSPKQQTDSRREDSEQRFIDEMLSMIQTSDDPKKRKELEDFLHLFLLKMKYQREKFNYENYLKNYRSLNLNKIKQSSLIPFKICFSILSNEAEERKFDREPRKKKEDGNPKKEKGCDENATAADERIEN